MNRIEQELALYRRAINEIDDRIEYTTFGRAAIYEILGRLTDRLLNLYADEPIPYGVTDEGLEELGGGK